MVGGNPNHGEIYGFLHRNEKTKQTFLALRNPAPAVQSCTIDTGCPEQVQIYPDFRRVAPGEKMDFGPHEVKLIAGSAEKWELPVETPFAVKEGKIYVENALRPGVKEIYCLPELVTLICKTSKLPDGIGIETGIRIPYRMRQSRLLLTLRNCGSQRPRIKLRYSRYGGWHDTSCYTFPVTEIPFGSPGYGEKKNPDMSLEPETRYYAFDVPQGGEAFFNLEICGTDVREKDIDLVYSGCMAPAREPEKVKWNCKELKNTLPPAHPEGFYMSKKLI